MPYNKQIDARIKKTISRWKNTEHKKMFGGVCHLLNGHMLCGVYKDYLILRLGEDAANEVLTESFTKEFDITGKPMKGWIMVEQEGFSSDKELKKWLEKARSFVRSLPKKQVCKSAKDRTRGSA